MGQVIEVVLSERWRRDAEEREAGDAEQGDQ